MKQRKKKPGLAQMLIPTHLKADVENIIAADKRLKKKAAKLKPYDKADYELPEQDINRAQIAGGVFADTLKPLVAFLDRAEKGIMRQDFTDAQLNYIDNQCKRLRKMMNKTGSKMPSEWIEWAYL